MNHTTFPSKTITVSTEQDGQRIDNFLFKILKGVPKSHIYALLRTGQVRANSKRIKAHYHIEESDVIRIPPLRMGLPIESKPPLKLCNLLAKKIIYEDENIIVVNKPPGMAAHGGSGINFGIIEILRELYPKKNLGLVHRLDRDTSGCLLIAKKRSALVSLHKIWSTDQVKKTYLALLMGQLNKNNYLIDAPLKKNVLSSGERMVKVDHEQGKSSITEFTVKQSFANATLVTATLYTGRTHQIRVHATHFGHPIAGDEKYGNKEFNHQLRALGLKRLFLHADTLVLRLPQAEKEVVIKAELDEELQVFLKNLSCNKSVLY